MNDNLTTTALPPTELFSAWVVADRQASDAMRMARELDGSGQWAAGSKVWDLAWQMEDTAVELGRLVRRHNSI